MDSKHKFLRWGALALLVALMSGCCVAPWGPRYYGGGYYHGGGYYGDHGGGGYYNGGYNGGGYGNGGGWHH